jgi:hypothetical protein
MKALYWFLAFLFGAYGVLSLLRAIEVLVAGRGIRPVAILFGIIALAIAGRCAGKARGR